MRGLVTAGRAVRLERFRVCRIERGFGIRILLLLIAAPRVTPRAATLPRVHEPVCGGGYSSMTAGDQHHPASSRATAVACPVLLGAASLVILLGTSGGSGTGAGWRWAAAAALVALIAAGVIVGLRNPKSKVLFLIVMAAAVIAVVLFAASGQALT